MNEENTFSFRMFDLYKRFVEIIQSNEAFLKEFKSGFPSEETCHAIIARTFQHRQPNNKVSSMVDYLRKNALILAEHAENVPAIWDTAVRYTNWCINEIKRYLKNKNISIKSNFELMPDVSNEIGKILYKKGANDKQIQIIKEYLKEDIRNPKKSVKCKYKEKILSQSQEKEKEVVTIENEETDSVITINGQDESNDAVQIISLVNNSQEEKSVPQSFFKEDLLKTEFTAEIENFLKPLGHQSANELLHISSPERSKEIVLQKKGLTQSGKLDKINTYNIEDIQSILESSKGENDDFTILEVREEIYLPNSDAEYSYNNTPSNYYMTNANKINANKRKILSSVESANYAKKLFVNNKGLSNNTEYITVSTDENVKDSNWDSVQYVVVSTDGNLKDSSDSVQIIETVENENVQMDENHGSISINVDDSERNLNQKSEKNTITSNNQKDTKNEMIGIDDIKTEPEVKQESKTCDSNMVFKDRAHYIEETVKYSDIMNLTHTEVLLMMEKILAFCELKNEISLEEYLVLRRTRDKMHLTSLKEKKPLKE